MRQRLPLAVAMLAAPMVMATDLPDVTIHAVASGATLRTGFAGHGMNVLPEVVYLKGDLTRVEFMDNAEVEYILRDGRARHSWLINEHRQVALPLGNGPTARQYVYSLERPCADFGSGTCSKGDASAVAGRTVVAWRYRNAGHAGPDGSDSGTMYLDTASGLLLGYDSKDLSGRPMKWTVTTVTFGDLDPKLFQLPPTAPKKPL